MKAIGFSQVRLCSQHQINVISKGAYSAVKKITNFISVKSFQNRKFGKDIIFPKDSAILA